MRKVTRALGIDSGSATISLALVEKDEGGTRLVKSAYSFHRGKPAEAIRGALAEISALGISEVDALLVCSRCPARNGAKDRRLSDCLAAVGLSIFLVVGAEISRSQSLARQLRPAWAALLRSRRTSSTKNGAARALRLGGLTELTLAAKTGPDIASRWRYSPRPTLSTPRRRDGRSARSARGFARVSRATSPIPSSPASSPNPPS